MTRQIRAAAYRVTSRRKSKAFSNEDDFGTCRENDSCRTIKTDFHKDESFLSLTRNCNQKDGRIFTSPSNTQSYMEDCDYLETSV